MTETDEAWKDVPGFDGQLCVSTVGNIWQYNTQRRRWTSPKAPTVLRHGYPTTVHRKKIYRVHYLMGITFLGPQPSPQHTVNHIAKYDGDWERERRDNRVENLEWSTKKEQTAYRSKSTARIDAAELCETPLKDEEFREVDGILVSQYGKTSNHYDKIYTPLPNKGMEYALVGTTRKTFHRLVARAFPEICGVPAPGQTTVDHRDRDRSNNYASNLRWATPTEQQFNTGRKDPNEIQENLKDAVEVRAPGEQTYRFYSSYSEASRAIQALHAKRISPQSISQLIRKNPMGGTIRMRQNAGWSFRPPRASKSGIQHILVHPQRF
jgi:hypothetical protein